MVKFQYFLYQPLKVATFKGDGFLELNGQALPLESSISFSFMTSQTDGLLLLSTFKGQDASKTDQSQVSKHVIKISRKLEYMGIAPGKN